MKFFHARDRFAGGNDGYAALFFEYAEWVGLAIAGIGFALLIYTRWIVFPATLVVVGGVLNIVMWIWRGGPRSSWWWFWPR